MKEKKIKFIFTGGGSGGHVSPALAVAAELKKTLPEADITYIGVKNKAEAHMEHALQHAPLHGLSLRHL